MSAAATRAAGPVSSSIRMPPRLYVFERWSTSFPSACSGDRYSGTPNTVSDTATGATKLITLTLVVGRDEHVLGATGRGERRRPSALRAAPRRSARRSSWRDRAAAARWRRPADPAAARRTKLADDEQAAVGVLAEVEHAREARALGALQLLELALRPLQRRPSSAATPARPACRRPSRPSGCRARGRPRRCASRRAGLPARSAGPRAPRRDGLEAPRALRASRRSPAGRS